MKYYVRTAGDREFDYSPLQYEVLVDTEHNAQKHFVDSLRRIKDENCVLLEDDLVLCKNFQEEIEKAIAEHPNDVINFFTFPEKFFTTHYTQDFMYNQCTYYPKGVLDKVIPILEQVLTEKPYAFYGAPLCVALRRAGIPHLVYRPALVQHKDVKSTIGKGYNRNTIYFKDYLDELGIPLLEAVRPENKERLTNRLEQDREKWTKEVIK